MRICSWQGNRQFLSLTDVRKRRLMDNSIQTDWVTFHIEKMMSPLRIYSFRQWEKITVRKIPHWSAKSQNSGQGNLTDMSNERGHPECLILLWHDFSVKVHFYLKIRWCVLWKTFTLTNIQLNQKHSIGLGYSGFLWVFFLKTSTIFH